MPCFKQLKKKLCEKRDKLARVVDESTIYIAKRSIVTPQMDFMHFSMEDIILLSNIPLSHNSHNLVCCVVNCLIITERQHLTSMYDY
jgi:hypothetical protein